MQSSAIALDLGERKLRARFEWRSRSAFGVSTRSIRERVRLAGSAHIRPSRTLVGAFAVETLEASLGRFCWLSRVRARFGQSMHTKMRSTVSMGFVASLHSGDSLNRRPLCCLCARPNSARRLAAFGAFRVFGVFGAFRARLAESASWDASELVAPIGPNDALNRLRRGQRGAQQAQQADRRANNALLWVRCAPSWLAS